MSNRNSLKPTCDCAIDRALHRDENYIFITGAQKQSDSPSGKSYIAYYIRIGVNVNQLIYLFLSITHDLLSPPVFFCNRISRRNEDTVNSNPLERL